MWGIWDDANGYWTEERRLNSIGRMSGLLEFDDEKALGEAGLEAMKDGQD